MPISYSHIPLIERQISDIDFEMDCLFVDLKSWIKEMDKLKEHYSDDYVYWLRIGSILYNNLIEKLDKLAQDKLKLLDSQKSFGY